MHGEQSTLPCTASIFMEVRVTVGDRGRNLENWKTGTLIPGIALHRPGFQVSRIPALRASPTPVSVDRGENALRFRVIQHVLPQPVVLLGARLGKNR